MADAVMASRARQQVEKQSGSPSLASRMVPQAKSEARNIEMAARLYSALFPERAATSEVPASAAGTNTSPLSRLPDLNPQQLRDTLQRGVERLQGLVPRVRGLATHPVMQRMILDVTTKAAARAAARAVQFVSAGAGSLRGQETSAE